MALEQDLTDAIAAETTAVDSVIAFIQGLPANTLDDAAKARVLALISSNRTKLEQVLTAGVTPPPTP